MREMQRKLRQRNLYPRPVSGAIWVPDLQKTCGKTVSFTQLAGKILPNLVLPWKLNHKLLPPALYWTGFSHGTTIHKG